MLNKILILTKQKINKLLNSHNGKDYALDSGERQVAKNIRDIRFDHICRYNYTVDIIRKYLGKDNILRGADIFCGNGYGSYIISKELLNLYSLLSIDGSTQAIKLARKYYQRNNICFKQKFFPFVLKEKTFDFIVSLETIEHLKEDYFFIDNLTKSLKQNGILILSTPNATKLSLEVNINKFHFRHYLFENIVAMMNLKGFSLLEYCGQDTYIIDENKRYIGLVNKEEMSLKPNYKGQFILYVFKKI